MDVVLSGAVDTADAVGETGPFTDVSGIVAYEYRLKVS